jgi:long-subunit acyl-CoA synthetase (AMP-forming)
VECVAALVADTGLERLVADAAPDCLRHIWKLADALRTTDAHEAEVERRRRALTVDSLATIVYTSGTTRPGQGLPDQSRQPHGLVMSTRESKGPDPT